MSTKDNSGNWSEYERLVLAELQRLDENQKAGNEKLDKVLALKDTVDDLKKRQDKSDDDIDELKSFRTQVKTIGVFIQLVIATVASYITGKYTGSGPHS